MRTSVVAAVLSLAAAHYASAAPAPEPQGSGVVPSSVPAAASTAGTAGSSAAASSGGSPSTTVVAGPVATSNVPTSSNQKYVWAHHIVGVTQNYTPDRWDKEVALAQSGGIDGFALNMGADSWQPQQIDAAYTAAGKASGSPFKMFLSFDTTSLGCKNASDVTRLADLVNKYAAHPAQAQYKGKTLVSTFGGERCTFGEKDVEAGWAAFRAKVTQGMHFVPATFMTPNDVRAGKWFDGGMQWDGGWPMGDSALTTRNDTEWLSALGNKTYMAAVSPFFFTYYGPQSWDKNWIYRSDDWLLATRFEQMISLRDKLDMIEIVSWNDFGESHYICDVPDAANQPGSDAWTHNMPHTALLSLIKYYSGVFKNGAYPAATQNKDALWLWTRPHPKDATATNPTLPPPARHEWTDDNLYAVVTLGAPANITVHSGSSNSTQVLQPGLAKLSFKSEEGPIKAEIQRDGKVIKSFDSTGTFEYKKTPTDYNFNYFVAEVADPPQKKSGALAIRPVTSAVLVAVLAALVWA